MDAVELSDKDERDPLVDIGRAVFVNVNVGAEIGYAPTALLSMRRNRQQETTEKCSEQLPGGRRPRCRASHGRDARPFPLVSHSRISRPASHALRERLSGRTAAAGSQTFRR